MHNMTKGPQFAFHIDRTFKAGTVQIHHHEVFAPCTCEEDDCECPEAEHWALFVIHNASKRQVIRKLGLALGYHTARRLWVVAKNHKVRR